MTKDELRRCRGLMLEAKHLRDMLVCLNAAAILPCANQTPAEPDVIPEAITRLWELESEYYTKLSTALVEVSKVEAAIEKLEPTLRVLVRMHYIQGLTWEATAEAMNYSEGRIWQLRTAALSALEDKD